MNKVSEFFINTFLRFTGYAYSNIGRLFLRLFVGVMFIQFGIRQLVNFSDVVQDFPSVMGLSPSCGLTLLIIIELVCSLLIMVGFLTRLATIPPIISMIVAEHYLLTDVMADVDTYTISSTQPGYLPLMFIAIYFFIILAGPGKISLDYFISLYFINRHGKDEKEELEEV